MTAKANNPPTPHLRPYDWNFGSVGESWKVTLPALNLSPYQFLTLSRVLTGLGSHAHFIRRLSRLTPRWHPPASNEARFRERRIRGRRGESDSMGFHLALAQNHPTCLWAKIKDLQNLTEQERQRCREEKISSATTTWKKKKDLSCQNSMSLSLKRELVIGRERKGEEEQEQEQGKGSSAGENCIFGTYAGHVSCSLRQKKTNSFAK